MERYIALLRGVNVGGNNKVPMSQLKAAFLEAGFSDVSTYINSGNVIFSGGGGERTVLQQKCCRIIADRFGLDIPVALLTGEELSDALDHAPVWWGRDQLSKHSAIFVIAPACADTLVEEVGVREEYEQVARHGQVIFWSAPLKTYSRTRWSKVVATRQYANITIRGAGTARKLLQLL